MRFFKEYSLAAFWKLWVLDSQYLIPSYLGRTFTTQIRLDQLRTVQDLKKVGEVQIQAAGSGTNKPRGSRHQIVKDLGPQSHNNYGLSALIPQ